MMITSVLLPVAAAILIPLLKLKKASLKGFAGFAAVLTGTFAAAAALEGGRVQLFSFGDELTVLFNMDGIAAFFTFVVTIAFTAVCFYFTH